MGKDCYNIYKSLPLDNENKEKIKSILDALEEYFKPNLNVTFERFIFNTCDQQNHESIDEYVNKLRGLSETCEFGTLRDSLIRDRIVLGTKNKQAFQAVNLHTRTICVIVLITRVRSIPYRNIMQVQAVAGLHDISFLCQYWHLIQCFYHSILRT